MNTSAAQPGAGRLLRDRNMRWLMAGAAISNLGDQFTLVALPWAVLQRSSDPWQLGLVLALIGIPRALFILLGGAVVDRHSPRRVLMLSKMANALLLAVLDNEVGPARDIVILNAGVALYAANVVTTMADGVALAREALASGKAMAKMQQFVARSKELAAA